MKLRHAALTAAAVLALVGAPAVAYAQDGGPQSPSCADALRIYLTAYAAVEALPEATIPNPALPGLQAAVTEAQTALDGIDRVGWPSWLVFTQAEVDRLQDIIDGTIDGNAAVAAEWIGEVTAVVTAQTTLATAQAALAAAPATVPNPVFDQAVADQLQVEAEAAHAAADAACEGQPGDPGPPPADSGDAPDLDCVDLPLPDGRTAQQVLDVTPDSDPHNLDLDGDRVACEIDDDTTSGDADSPSVIGGVAVPAGGVATGGGPA